MLDLIGAVNGGSFSQFFWCGLIISPGQDQIPYIYCSREEDRPYSVYHVQLIDQDKGRDHTTVKEHGDNKDHIKKSSSYKFFLRHRIGRQQSNKYGNQSKGC